MRDAVLHTHTSRNKTNLHTVVGPGIPFRSGCQIVRIGSNLQLEVFPVIPGTTTGVGSIDIYGILSYPTESEIRQSKGRQYSLA